MISPALLGSVRCPVCLEPEGCARCARPAGGHAACAEYAMRTRCGCGGVEKVRLDVERGVESGGLRCPCCGVLYPVNEVGGFADLVPRTNVGEVTQYADHEFHERLGVTDAPPVLSARVKADMMLRMLEPEEGSAVLDLGCGAGKFALFAASAGARAAGLDVAPFFLDRATREVDLVLGDLRRLPFGKGSFPRAYSLDVLEHLHEEGVREVLVEARRTVGPEGRLFVYTHAMESSRIASFQRAVNRLAKRLGRAGLIDHEREAMRKSDHKNAIRSHEHFEEMCAAAGLRVAERRYYNVVFKAVVEDLLLRLVEQWRRRQRPSAPHGLSDAPDAAADIADIAHPAHREPGSQLPSTVGAPPPGRIALAVALGLTWLLKLDVVLFGGIRTGPFFGRLEPSRPAGGPGATEHRSPPMKILG